MGIAVDAASRGYSTLLLEQSDFAKGTSSRSTKLVHGGVRYLAQGNIKLVYDALRERGLLLKNAPHLVKRQSFIVPCYTVFAQLKYGIGLKLYDWLSGTLSFGSSRWLNKKEVLQHLPGIREKNLVGGVLYYDGQFDDARLAINLAQTAAENGAVLLNYCRVKSLYKESGKISGVAAVDTEADKEYSIQAKVVVNATGVFVDDVLRMNAPDSPPLVRASQGVHLVVNKSFLPGESALMIPQTSDGRVLFAVPWHQHVLVGTTDTPLPQAHLEPVALDAEVAFILQNVRQYLQKKLEKKDVLSVFAGLRPLAAPLKNTAATKEISRDHKLLVSESGLITITGGKWTTYRKMAEETVNIAAVQGGLRTIACRTKDIQIHGYNAQQNRGALSVYGADAPGIQRLVEQDASLNKTLLPHLPYTEAEVVWAVQHEMARTVEDVLARRLRLLFLDAQAAMDAAPRVAQIMAGALHYPQEWVQQQVQSFRALASNYLVADD